MRGDNIRQDAEVLALEAIELIRVSIGGLWPAPRAAVTAPSRAAARRRARPHRRCRRDRRHHRQHLRHAAPATRRRRTDGDRRGCRATEAPLPAVTASTRTPWRPCRGPRADRPELTLGLGVAALRDAAAPSTQWVGALSAVARWPGGFAARASFAGFRIIGHPVGSRGHRRSFMTRLRCWEPGGTFRPRGPRRSTGPMALGAAHVDVSGIDHRSRPSRTRRRNLGFDRRRRARDPGQAGPADLPRRRDRSRVGVVAAGRAGRRNPTSASFGPERSSHSACRRASEMMAARAVVARGQGHDAGDSCRWRARVLRAHPDRRRPLSRWIRSIGRVSLRLCAEG